MMMMMMMIALFSIQHTVHMKRVEQEVQDLLYKALRTDSWWLAPVGTPTGRHAIVRGVKPIMPSRIKRDVATLRSRLSQRLVTGPGRHSPSGW